ncbi:MAG: stalk domain-containing protein [Bacillota bacterium]
MKRILGLVCVMLVLSLPVTALAAGPASVPGAPTTAPTQPETTSPTQPETTSPTQPETTSPAQPETTSPAGELPAAGKPEETGSPVETGRPADPAAKAKEVLTNLLGKLAEQLPEEAQATEALETALQAMTDGLVESGAVADEAEAEAMVEGAIEEKQSSGRAGKRELDLLAHIQQKKGEVEAAVETLLDRVAVAPEDLEGYKAVTALREKAGLDKGIEAFVGGKEVTFDVRPVIQDGRTLVPVRALTEALGADVSWDEASQTVIIKANGKEIRLVINSRTVSVDGREVVLDVPATILDNRTVIPLRFVVEALGLQVEWLSDTQTIVVLPETE